VRGGNSSHRPARGNEKKKKMDTKIGLTYIHSITFTLKDIKGKEHSFSLTSKTLIDRIKSIMYQTLGYAVSRDLEKKIEDIALMNLPDDNELFEAVRKREIKIDSHISIYGVADKKCHFHINDRKFEYQSRKKAEEDLEMAKILYKNITTNKK